MDATEDLTIWFCHFSGFRRATSLMFLPHTADSVINLVKVVMWSNN
ncbi:MAG: hypothetical protein O4807_15200 [Trichodesmium sp. St19_bin2]|nr:hypothetical protein [Trichodesmium sp. St4_bin8_1]MDE5071792.1 hypothetical protein [Trichodesmium sp. St5_bin8]MDE5104263.1 hypothetical protein [Trichodesmium sp. St19_bin2]